MARWMAGDFDLVDGVENRAERSWLGVVEEDYHPGFVAIEHAAKRPRTARKKVHDMTRWKHQMLESLPDFKMALSVPFSEPSLNTSQRNSIQSKLNCVFEKSPTLECSRAMISDLASFDDAASIQPTNRTAMAESEPNQTASARVKAKEGLTEWNAAEVGAHTVIGTAKAITTNVKDPDATAACRSDEVLFREDRHDCRIDYGKLSIATPARASSWRRKQDDKKTAKAFRGSSTNSASRTNSGRKTLKHEEDWKNYDVLHGCERCRFDPNGCKECHDRPTFLREKARWDPEAGHGQTHIPEAKTFRPTVEEFSDPIAYISSIMPEASKYGIAHIVPPKGWDPPFAFQHGTDGSTIDSFRFYARKQFTSSLCVRSAEERRYDAMSKTANASEPAAGNGHSIERPSKMYIAGCHQDADQAHTGQSGTATMPRGGTQIDGADRCTSLSSMPLCNPDGNCNVHSHGACREESVHQAKGPGCGDINVKQHQQRAGDADGADTNQNLEEKRDAGTDGPTCGTSTPEKSASQIGISTKCLGMDGATEVEDEAHNPRRDSTRDVAALRPCHDAKDESEGRPQMLKMGDPGKEKKAGEFGFVTLSRHHTLRSFAAYADWAKAMHFSAPLPRGGDGISSAPAKRPLEWLPMVSQCDVEPSVAEIEAEFWRLVETGSPTVESLYGQDIDSGLHGSGFPLPEWRRALLRQHFSTSTPHDLCTSTKPTTGGDENGKAVPVFLDGSLPQEAGSSSSIEGNDPRCDTGQRCSATNIPPTNAAVQDYSLHPWNINNMPRCESSVLSYLTGCGLITGVMIPWLYVGSCLSAFCWHVEDHALYSVNYLHMGSPKIWYAVPASATAALEEAMRDALPHLFEKSPDLLYQLVTMVSPSELQRRGIPVYRAVHEAGSFMITMPNAYHAGLNTGFNVAEAVNFAAPEWIPFGTDVISKYREASKPVALSHDSLLVSLTSAALHHPLAKADDFQLDTEHSSSDREKSAGCRTDEWKETTSKTEEDRGASATSEDLVVSKSPDAVPGFVAHLFPFSKSNLSLEKSSMDPRIKGILLAAGDLALRAKEERERWMRCLKALGLGTDDAIPLVRSDARASIQSIDSIGFFDTNPECDCHYCKCDLWLNAVVSCMIPGVATCIEHAPRMIEQYGCSVDSLRVLSRYTPLEVEQLLERAKKSVLGIDDAIGNAIKLREELVREAPTVRKLGPLYCLDEEGMPIVK